MAIRVDDIVVSNKNIIILHGGHQLVAGLGKTNNGENSCEYNSFICTDGSVVHNLFDVSDFTIRTSILTGGSSVKSMDLEAHEVFYMPNPSSYAGITQFYDSAYSICDNTSEAFSYNCNMSRSESETITSDTSIVRYSPLTAYDNISDYYIQPDVAITNEKGCQYLFEYPFERYYYDFGSAISNSNPTIYSDCYALKTHLDETYSVNSYTIRDGNAAHENLRTYYGIGNSGDSIYLVYRNNQSGTSVVSNYKPTEDKTIHKRIITSEISKIGYMPNYTATLSANTIFTGANPYSDFASGSIATSRIGIYDYIKQPKDNSFLLTVYVNQEENNTALYFIPNNSTDSAIRSMIVADENLKDDDFIQLDNSIVITTNKHGMIVVKSSVYDISTGEYNSFSTSPFGYSKVGSPDSDNFIILDSDSEYSGFNAFYNGKDILAVTATKTTSAISTRMCLFSTDTISEDEKSYTIGELFMIAGTPGLTALDEAKCNVADGFNVLFDYSSIENDDLFVGSYAFVQFSDYGLAKVYVDDIFSEDDFVHMTTTGPTNRLSKDDSIIATDVRFNVLSYESALKDKMRTVSNFVGNSSTNGVIYGSPSLNVTYRDSNNNYLNSSSLLPISEERSQIVENLFNGSESPSAYAECRCIDRFKYIKDCPIEKSCAVSVKSFKANTINHDAAISLVKWNTTNGLYNSEISYDTNSSSIGGLHLQYCGTCSEVLVTGRKDSVSGSFYSTIYEYPHPCYGNLKTAGTGLPIFEGELDDSMSIGDISVINNYVVVTNYCVKSMSPTYTTQDDSIKQCGKTYSYQTGSYPSGGYVVTNFFAADSSTVPNLYDSELKVSNVDLKNPNSDAMYNYEYLWHIKPSIDIEFYPESKDYETWRPYYSGKHVDSIQFHNGYYYIVLSDSNIKTKDTYSYDVIETQTLFSEKPYTKLEKGKYVSGMKFFDDNVCVEYCYDGIKEVKWFKQGYSSNKSNMLLATTDGLTDITSVNRAELSLHDTTTDSVVTRFDNVEVIKSLNRFTSNVCHKSNIFSIRVEDLGLDESDYLTDYQKSKLKTWFKNKITKIVDMTKPANTQLLDVEL